MAKSIRTNRWREAVKGDERIRTAEQAPGADPVYERKGEPEKVWYKGRWVCPECYETDGHLESCSWHRGAAS